MRIPDEWLSAVFFLGMDRTRGGLIHKVLVGTGFYFQVDNEFDPSLHRIYFVTARHVVEGAQSEPGSFHVRVNTEDGGSIWAETSKTDWVLHEDPTIDVAVLAPTFADEAPRGLESTRLHDESCITEGRIAQYDIGVGTDASAIGLFNSRGGTERNIPIVRAGVIAAMPGELIDDGHEHGPFRAYLVELLSMGGLSGSPVFVHVREGPWHVHEPERLRTGMQRVHTVWPQAAYLIGLIHGHWDELPPGASPDLPRRDWLNRGMALVTPIKGVLDIVRSELFKEQRREDAERVRQTHAGDS
jgi:hypothetical protein